MDAVGALLALRAKDADDAAARRRSCDGLRLRRERVRKITDEGLLRNYLNKNPNGSKIVPACTKEWLARKHAAPAQASSAPCPCVGSLREPFERLVEAGLRMNELRSAARAHGVPHRGGDRALRCAARAARPRVARRLRASRARWCRSGEDASALWREVEPSLDAACGARARRPSRTCPDRAPRARAALAHRGAARRAQRARRRAVRRHRRRVRPLPRVRPRSACDAREPGGSRARQRAAGRRRSSKRSRSAQPRSAARERARDHQQHPARASRRASTSRASWTSSATSCARSSRPATSASAGSTRRRSSSITSTSSSTASGSTCRPRRCAATAPFRAAYTGAKRVVLNTRAESDALGVGTIPGTDASKSGVFVPIIGSDRVLGSIILENYEREYAFGEAEVRLLRTVAAGMGVALENARLYSRVAATAQGDRAAQRRARRHQQHPARDVGEPRLPVDRRPGRRQAARSVRQRRHRHSLARRDGRTATTSTSTSTACASRCRRRRSIPTAWSRRSMMRREPL